MNITNCVVGGWEWSCTIHAISFQFRLEVHAREISDPSRFAVPGPSRLGTWIEGTDRFASSVPKEKMWFDTRDHNSVLSWFFLLWPHACQSGSSSLVSSLILTWLKYPSMNKSQFNSAIINRALFLRWTYSKHYKFIVRQICDFF